VAETAAEYVQAVRGALGADDEARRRRGFALVERSSWEHITGEMSRLMEEAVLARQRRRRVTCASSGATTTRTERGVRRAP
jgi:hypothetical protein